MQKRNRLSKRDYKALNAKVPGVRYPAGQGRVQLRGEQPRFIRQALPTREGR